MSLKSAIKLAKGFDEIRSAIAAAMTPFGKCTVKEKTLRRVRALKDLDFFAQTYFPHYLTAAPSTMHKDLYKKFQGLIEAGLGAKSADAAPRGNAKSTLATLVLPLWCVVSKKRKFVAAISDTTEQAEGFVEFIKAELEINERLQEDFPEACGKGRTWKVGHIVTANGVLIRAWGSGKRIRGARHGSARPDLVICDDLENDENVESPDQRRKMSDWFFKAVMKIGSPSTIYIIVGTILHYDSLLSKLLNQPGWIGKKYKAVIKFSTSPLWEEWERLYAERKVDSAQLPETANCQPSTADLFFEKHKAEMLAGTEVLWPEVEPYYYLMKMRVSDGPAAFDSEKQNEPINPDDCVFSEEWFQYFDTLPKDCQYFAACDPSMGKASHKADPSAIIVGAVGRDGIIHIVEADIVKRHPDRIMEALFTFHWLYKFQNISIEEVAFQEFFKDQLIKESARKRVYLPVRGCLPSGSKENRIMRLQAPIKNGHIRFRRDQRILLDQLKYFPKADHDDGPDALEMLFNLIQGPNAPRIRVLGAAA